jgi:hypothetical protein
VRRFARDVTQITPHSPPSTNTAPRCIALDSAAAVRLHRLVREGPKLTAGRRADRDARAARLGAALRDNLRRRKDQARAQDANREQPGGVPAGLSGTGLSGKSRICGEDVAD